MKSLVRRILVPLLAAVAVGCNGVGDGAAEDGSVMGQSNGAGGALSSGALATLLVAGDFSAAGTAPFNALQSLAQQELNADPNLRLVAAGDISYAAPSSYGANYPWHGFEARTFGAAGNHDMANSGGTFYSLFNGVNAAGNHRFPALGSSYDFTYSYPVVSGKWLIVVLNTGINFNTQTATSQATNLGNWVSAFRSANGGHGCVAVVLHQARFSSLYSGYSDNGPAWANAVDPIWKSAVGQKVDLVLQGHVHVYEEFKKLDANGNPSATGTKLFTVGSGGRGQASGGWSNAAPGSVVTSVKSPATGALKLWLNAGSYSYKFETAPTLGTPPPAVPCNVP